MVHVRKSTARRWRCAWIGLLVLLFTSAVFAGPGQLLTESIQLMAAGKYDEAATKMFMYLEMVEESKTPRVIEIAQDIRYKLAGILVKENRLGEAAEVLLSYIENPLGKHPRKALKMLSTCYYEDSKFKDCVGAITNALEYNENPVIVVGGGGEDDPEYTPTELELLNLTLGEAYFKLGEWAKGVDPFTYVIKNTTDDQRKGYAIMQVVNGLINIPDFPRIKEWIPQLYRTEARFDIRVNMALMNAAKALYEAKEFDNALPLYRMIIPRDELVAYQQNKLRAMRVAAGLPSDEDMEATKDELLLFGIGEDAEGVEKPKELIKLENMVAKLVGLPAYENNIKYRMALIYKGVGRYWEAVRFYDSIYAADPASKIGERAIYELVSVLLENLDETAEAEEYAFNYMGRYTEGVTPRQIAYLLTSHYHKKDEMELVKALLPYLDAFVPSDDPTLAKYDAELYFMQGVADLMLFNYEKSAEAFKRVLDEFPGSHQEGNAIYWRGMSKLFIQKYTEALPIFEKYVHDFPEGPWVEDTYFQVGTCFFGMEQYEEAMERFSFVIDNYPDSSAYPSACSMRGDLYGADGLLDAALADYRNAVAACVVLKDTKQASYATFQMAEVFSADAESSATDEQTQAKYNELIDVVQSYLDTWGTEADIAKALFWIGKTRIQQKRLDEAVKTYVDAIVKFGGDVRQDGVDMMISELVKVSAIWLGVAEQVRLMNDLQAALDATDDLVLQLRLRVTMAKLDNTEVELGKRLIKELPDMESASPPALAAICNASFEMKDYSRAEELLRIFINRYEDSEYMRAAYRLRAYGLYAEKDFEGALETISEAQEIYGHARDVVWAQLMKGRILLNQGKLDEAREAYMYVFREPKWRGEPVAEATFQVGQVEEADGNLRKAFGFYQRTYFQYKGHAAGYWAAEGYLASARCLQKLGLEEDRLKTYQAMLYDTFVNDLPQAEVARKELGSSEVAEIETFIATGEATNVVVSVRTGGMQDTTLTKTNKLDSAMVETNKSESVEAETADSAAMETNMEEPSEAGTNVVDATGAEGES